ncbi:diguanylate cyclase [Clostridium carboxidivorans P7]|uniref:Nitroreductase n=1 Tax=Clostridium carboxidivorans P7 TaxID=536227 RepID=C6PMZ9_9CLOT|nr:nitroreductase family protein [Clostridium carboxidivorans]AKN30894.1 diguanylate cyclase [Clostridium carboxidivorans P7]EET89332.1 nitroreductase [Clostridium carboxidivorans P7]EFG88858.1 nitroreductase family protein [Clostridium carboxidivorans P7]
MNETMKTLLNRRSIRKYKSEQIKDEELKAVLEAGKYAPSGANQQSALFIVVQNKDIIKKISKMNAAVMEKENVDPYYGAPTVILVLADKSKATPVEDASIALGNMYNAAYSLGLGSCWIHRTREMFESGEGKKLLKEWGVEGDYIGVGSCILGYPDCELPKPAPRKDNFVIMVK